MLLDHGPQPIHPMPKAITSTSNENLANGFLEAGWLYVGAVALPNLTNPTLIFQWDSKHNDPVYPPGARNPGVRKATGPRQVIR